MLIQNNYGDYMPSRSLNRATLIGNLGRDPELKTTPHGSSVCTIRIATTENFRDRNGELKEATEWHSIVLWDRLAEIAAEQLRKGDRIYVEGKLRTRQFDKGGGHIKYFTEIIVFNLIILDKKHSHTKDNHDKHDDFYDEKTINFDDSFLNDEDFKSI